MKGNPILQNREAITRYLQPKLKNIKTKIRGDLQNAISELGGEVKQSLKDIISELVKSPDNSKMEQIKKQNEVPSAVKLFELHDSITKLNVKYKQMLQTSKTSRNEKGKLLTTDKKSPKSNSNCHKKILSNTLGKSMQSKKQVKKKLFVSPKIKYYQTIQELAQEGNQARVNYDFVVAHNSNIVPQSSRNLGQSKTEGKLKRCDFFSPSCKNKLSSRYLQNSKQRERTCANGYYNEDIGKEQHDITQ